MWSAVHDRLGFTSSNEAAGFDGKLWSLSGGGRHSNDESVL